MVNFELVKQYLFELGYEIQKEDAENEIVIITDTNKGINNLVIDCEEPIIILEQFILKLKDKNDAQILSKLLKMNRTLVHGAFVLDEEGENVLFRDTLQLENLDLNELKGSIDSLIIAMNEYVSDFIGFMK